MKKTLAILSVASMIILAMPTATLAHGHGGGYNTAPGTNYSVCATENCTQSGLHYHDGTAYTAHEYNDGHAYHQSWHGSDQHH